MLSQFFYDFSHKVRKRVSICPASFCLVVCSFLRVGSGVTRGSFLIRFMSETVIEIDIVKRISSARTMSMIHSTLFLNVSAYTSTANRGIFSLGEVETKTSPIHVLTMLNIVQLQCYLFVVRYPLIMSQLFFNYPRQSPKVF